jgi:hypothetical protein
MSSKKHYGKCCICGTEGELTFEHTPPRSAFNNQEVRYYSLVDKQTRTIGYDENKEYTQSQRGLGGYSLCARCNNNTGYWYGKAFLNFAIQGLHFYNRGQSGVIELPFFIYPLNVIKQIITTLIATCSPGFIESQIYLRKFILDQETKYLPDNIRIFIYMPEGFHGRKTGIMGMLDLNSHSTSLFCELLFPPFGYIMSIDGSVPSKAVQEISFFSQYNYNEFQDIFIKIPRLSCVSDFPLDYRTRKQMEDDYEKQITEQQMTLQ